MNPLIPLTKRGSNDIPVQIPRAYGQVIALPDHNVKSVFFPDIPSNPSSIRGKFIKFVSDDAHPVSAKPDDWVVANWTRSALYDSAHDAIRLEGKMGRANLVPMDRAFPDSFQQQALLELEVDHKNRFAASPGTRIAPNPYLAVRTRTSVPSENLFGSDTWLPTPVPMPILEEEWNFDDHYIRIGYVSFSVDSPTEDIQITETLPFRSIQTLRSRTPIQKDNWHAIQQITFSLTFNGARDINGVLLPLIRLFRRAPFLPVFNKTLLNQNITALALQNISIETIPGFPNALKARISCYSFNWEGYLSGADQIEGLDSAFCYPLLKIWAERPDSNLSEYIPMRGSWDGEFRMSHPLESWIQAVTELPVLAARSQNIYDMKKSVIELKKLIDNNFTTAPDKSAGFEHELGTEVGKVGEKKFLNNQWGYALLHDGLEYVFFRPSTVEVARLLIDSPDLVGVIAGTVEIERVNNLLTRSGTFWKQHWDITSPSLFKQQIEDPAATGVVSTILSSKQYTFLFRPPAPALDRILKIPTPKAPNPDLTTNIVPDEGSMIDDLGMVIEQITITSENTLAPLQLRGHRTPTFQYLGSNSSYFQISGILRSSALVGRLQDFFERVNELGRRYRGSLDGSPFGGFILVENELFQLVGVKTVLPINWSVASIPGFPEAMRFQITLVEFDATQRKIETLKDLNESAAQNPLTAARSQQDPISLNYWRQSDFNKRLRLTEVYPDLGLPTHKELAKWLHDIQADQVWDWDQNAPRDGYEYLSIGEGGTGWQWSHKERRDANGRLISAVLPDEFANLPPPIRLNRFADPDFYCAPTQNWGKEFVEQIVKDSKSISYQYVDTYGVKAISSPGNRLTKASIPDAATNPIIKQAEDTLGKILPIGASQNPIDFALQEKSPDPVINLQTGELMSSKNYIAPLSAGVSPIPPESIQPNDVNDPNRRFRYYQGVAEAAAQRWQVPLDWFYAIIDLESQWNSQARSPDGGALGLGQLREGARLDTLLQNPFNPTDNLFAAAHYFRIVADRLNDGGGNVPWERAVAAYNRGADEIKKANTPDGITPKGRIYLFQVARLKKKYDAILDKTSEPTRVESVLLKKYFTTGYGYPLKALRDYIIDPAAEASPFGTPQNFFLDGPIAKDIGNEIGGFFSGPPKPGQVTPVPGEETVRAIFFPPRQKPEAFIKPEWLVRAQDDPNHVVDFRETQIGNGESWYWIRPEHVQEFLTQMKRHNVASLKAEKIPERVPGKNPYDYGQVDTTGIPHSIEETYFDPVEGRDIFHDLRQSSIQGRLLGAFPTFYVALVDGGRSLRIWRLFDHVYGMLGVTRISVHRTRKGPIDTAVIGFSNMYNHLTSQQYEIERIQSQDTRGIWNIGAIWRSVLGFFRPFDGEVLAMWAQHLDRLMLKAGTRLHVRMGYGSDAVQLPVVFNGVITEVPISEGEVEVVALSDGIELVNDLAPNALQGSMPVVRLNSFLGGGLHPRELVMQFMAPNSFLDSISNAAGQVLGQVTSLGNALYYNFRNEYGIEHFGNPIRRFLGFDDGEIGINIYNPEHSQPLNQSTAWDNFARIFQPLKWDKNQGLIGVDMGGATPWAIFDMTRHTIPDYILAVEPVELRSTLFMGKGWFPLYGNYRDEVDGDISAAKPETPREKLFQWKPFQQVHIIHSDWNLIGNHVRTDATNVVTKVQAVGTYNGWKPGASDLSNEAGFVMMLDQYILDEFQKMKVVESGLYSTFGTKIADAFSNNGGKDIGIGIVTTAIGLLAKSPLLTTQGLLQTSAPFVRSFLFSRRVLDYYGAMVLKDHVKEMYQGPLVVLGNPYIKPYDYLGITDQMSGLNGLAETKEVTHLMSLETGFVTQASPDCIANFQDFEGQDLFVWLAHTVVNFSYAYASARIIGNLSRTMSRSSVLKGLERLEKALTTQVENLKKSPDLANAADITKKEKILLELRRDISTAKSIRGATQTVAFRETLDKVFTNSEWIEALKDLPVNVKANLSIQRFLFGLPSSKAGQFATSQATKGIQFAQEQAQKIKVGASQKLEALKRLKDAQKNLNKNDAELIKQVRQKMKAGNTLLAEEKVIASSITEVEEAKAAVRGVRVAQVASRGLNAGADALAWTRNLFSKSGALVALAGVINIGIGGLADWTIRWSIARQCLTLLPLRVHDKEWSAGIIGHRGAVYGDSLIGVSKLLQLSVSWARKSPFGQLIPVLNALADSGVNYETPKIPSWLVDVEQRTRKSSDQ